MKSLLKILSVCSLTCILLVTGSLKVLANPVTIVEPASMGIKPPITISESLVDVSASPGIVVDPTRR